MAHVELGAQVGEAETRFRLDHQPQRLARGRLAQVQSTTR
jgi:hypothetical protein